MDNETDSPRMLEKADPGHQVSLVAEVAPDPMEGEQTWPTEEELAEADGESETILRVYMINQ